MLPILSAPGVRHAVADVCENIRDLVLQVSRRRSPLMMLQRVQIFLQVCESFLQRIDIFYLVEQTVLQVLKHRILFSVYLLVYDITFFRREGIVLRHFLLYDIYNRLNIHSYWCLTADKFVFELRVYLTYHFSPQGYALVFSLQICVILHRALVLPFEWVRDSLEVLNHCSRLRQNSFSRINHFPVNFAEYLRRITNQNIVFGLRPHHFVDLVARQVNILFGYFDFELVKFVNHEPDLLLRDRAWWSFWECFDVFVCFRVRLYHIAELFLQLSPSVFSRGRHGSRGIQGSRRIRGSREIRWRLNFRIFLSGFLLWRITFYWVEAGFVGDGKAAFGGITIWFIGTLWKVSQPVFFGEGLFGFREEWFQVWRMARQRVGHVRVRVFSDRYHLIRSHIFWYVLRWCFPRC